MSAVEHTALSIIDMVIGLHYENVSPKLCSAQIVRQLRAAGISLVSTAKLKELQNERITQQTI